MNWYYVEAGQRVGPLSEDDFRQVVSQGRVAAATLIWREGMANWQPYGDVVAAGVAASPAAVLPGLGEAAQAASMSEGPRAFCSQCGRYLPVDDLIAYENQRICADCKLLFFQRLREGVVPVPVAGQFRYAGFWIRFAAHLIDAIMLFVVNIVLGVILGVAVIAGARSGRDASTSGLMMQLLLNLISTAIAVTYETIMIGKYGASVGKMACGLRVIISDGEKVSYLRAFARYWAKFLSAIILLIGYIIAGFDDEKRALHDHICNTRVIYK